MRHPTVIFHGCRRRSRWPLLMGTSCSLCIQCVFPQGTYICGRIGSKCWPKRNQHDVLSNFVVNLCHDRTCHMYNCLLPVVENIVIYTAILGPKRSLPPIGFVGITKSPLPQTTRAFVHHVEPFPSDRLQRTLLTRAPKNGVINAEKSPCRASTLSQYNPPRLMEIPTTHT